MNDRGLDWIKEYAPGDYGTIESENVFAGEQNLSCNPLDSPRNMSTALRDILIASSQDFENKL